jgi:hypothetical protein
MEQVWKPMVGLGRWPNRLHRIAVVAVSIAGGGTRSRISLDAAGKKASAKAPGGRISVNVDISAAAGCLSNGRRAATFTRGCGPETMPA